jgi:hypothetical protein
MEHWHPRLSLRIIWSRLKILNFGRCCEHYSNFTEFIVFITIIIPYLLLLMWKERWKCSYDLWFACQIIWKHKKRKVIEFFFSNSHTSLYVTSNEYRGPTQNDFLESPDTCKLSRFPKLFYWTLCINWRVTLPIATKDT